MKDKWEAINAILDIASQKVKDIDSSISLKIYVHQLSNLIIAKIIDTKVTNTYLQNFERGIQNEDASLYRTLENLIKRCKLTEKGYELKNLIKCDLFNEVIKSIEKHEIECTIDMAIDFTKAALKQDVINAALKHAEIKDANT